MSDFNTDIIEQFRSGSEPQVGPFPRSRLVVLHTVGARSGADRATPLMSFPDGDGGRFIVASKAGAPEHPAWFHNLLAQPAASIEADLGSGVQTFDVQASVLDAADRDRVYAEIVAVAPGFGEYERKTDRVIPVVRLAPR